jgi:2-polyprenyl-3-methyl-5-hydroxy-6-metoxy-1,4-benzoquinol methylase
MDLKSTYNKIAEDWTKDHANDTWWIAGTDKFSSFLKIGDSILDVGCASGIKSEYLAKKGFIVTGIDLSDKMIELAKQRMPNGSFFVKDINEPLDLKIKFDGIFAQAVLLHISKKDVKKVLGNLLDLLNPNGHIYIAVKKANEGQVEEQVKKENDYGYEYERFFSFYTLEELKNYLQEFSLKIIYHDITAIGKTDWIQVIAQK